MRVGYRVEMAKRPEARHLTLAEWAVLGLLGCGPQHAFAIVKSLARGGELGRVWSVATPVVYRAVNSLRDDGLIEALGERAQRGGTAAHAAEYHARWPTPPGCPAAHARSAPARGAQRADAQAGAAGVSSQTGHCTGRGAVESLCADADWARS